MDNSHPAPKAPLGYGRISATQSNKNTISTSLLTWENGRHLATLSLVPRHLRNERRNSILMTRHYPDLGSASDWLNQISHAASVWNFCARFSDVIWRGKPVVASPNVGCFLRFIGPPICRPTFGRYSTDISTNISVDFPYKTQDPAYLQYL